MSTHRLNKPTAVSLSRGPSWVHESPFMHIAWEEGEEEEKEGKRRRKGKSRGVPSLRYLAMRQTLADQRYLRPELFKDVPWFMAEEMWDCLGRCGKQTLYMWKLFATAYPSQFRGVTKYRCVKIYSPKMPMREYLGLVGNDNTNNDNHNAYYYWTVVFTLDTQFARVPGLVDVAAVVKNLVALEVYTPSTSQQRQAVISGDVEVSPSTTLSDRVVRTWSELARSSGAFAHLRLLRLYNQENLSRVVLRYLKSFPSLRVILIQNCPGITTSVVGNNRDLTEEDGWGVGLFSQLTEGSNDTDDHDSLYECYQASLKMVDDADDDDEHTVNQDTPIIDFQIGCINHEGDPKRKNCPKVQPVTVLFRRKSMNQSRDTAEPDRKRPKLGSPACGEEANASRSSSKRAVMRNRRKKDLTRVLEEFL